MISLVRFICPSHEAIQVSAYMVFDTIDFYTSARKSNFRMSLKKLLFCFQKLLKYLGNPNFQANCLQNLESQCLQKTCKPLLLCTMPLNLLLCLVKVCLL
jgi:hypothetical protein